MANSLLVGALLISIVVVVLIIIVVLVGSRLFLCLLEFAAPSSQYFPLSLELFESLTSKFSLQGSLALSNLRLLLLFCREAHISGELRHLKHLRVLHHVTLDMLHHEGRHVELFSLLLLARFLLVQL